MAYRKYKKKKSYQETMIALLSCQEDPARNSDGGELAFLILFFSKTSFKLCFFERLVSFDALHHC